MEEDKSINPIDPDESKKLPEDNVESPMEMEGENQQIPESQVAEPKKEPEDPGQELSSNDQVASAAKPAADTAPIKKTWRRSSAIGIDIGTHSVKIVQMSHKGHDVQIDKMIMADLPADVVESKKDHIDALKDTFKEVIQKNKIKGKAFSVIANDQVQIKTITLPQMPHAEIAEAVEWQMKQNMEVGAEDIVSDFILLNNGEVDLGGNFHILVVSAKRQAVIDYLNFLKSMKINCLAIEPNTFSLAGCLNYNQRFGEGEVVMVIDFGGNESTLSIIRNGEVDFVRQLDVSGHSFVSAIMDSAGVSYEEAEDIMRRNSEERKERVNDGSNAIIITALMFQLEKLVSDIEHTFKFYSFRLTKSEVTHYDKIILCGGVAKLPLLRVFLQERFEIPVEVDDPLRKVKLSKGLKLDEKIDSFRFSVAIGSALRMLD